MNNKSYSTDVYLWGFNDSSLVYYTGANDVYCGIHIQINTSGNVVSLQLEKSKQKLTISVMDPSDRLSFAISCD